MKIQRKLNSTEMQHAESPSLASVLSNVVQLVENIIEHLETAQSFIKEQKTADREGNKRREESGQHTTSFPFLESTICSSSSQNISDLRLRVPHDHFWSGQT